MSQPFLGSPSVPNPQVFSQFYSPSPVQNLPPGVMSVAPGQQLMSAAPNQMMPFQPAVVSSQAPPMVQTAQQVYFQPQPMQAVPPPQEDPAMNRKIAELHAKLQESTHKTMQLQYDIDMQMADPTAMQTELQITALVQELIQLRTKAEGLEEQCFRRKAEVDQQSIQAPDKLHEKFNVKLQEMAKKHSDLEASVRKYEEEKLRCQQRLMATPDLEPQIESLTRKLEDLKEKSRNLEDSCLKFQAERVDGMQLQRQYDTVQRQLFQASQDGRAAEARRLQVQLDNEKLRALLRSRSRTGQTRYG
eukprot:CAMPEP_0196733490 /NCGR_PEP_ID=MMETSP1091-20130531/12522_1 /TAXON_ID=302021 /ORGANISM="Rhodomonas sp., Strain CCMP768" /LENGTH=302 /DNA_ID=CAMNT_0042076865 /DNA_START=37 /DNA_END=942 /DNA_ORIENTATION=-